ncbi:MAG: SNF2-related protein [Pirellulales bacterium]
MTDYHAKLFAHDLTKRCASDNVEKLTAVLSDAQVNLNPHQIEAALFAFRNPLSKGAILADEVGLGKTIEAGLLIAQKWAESGRRILVIAPANLRKQWAQELADKFFLPSAILEARTFNECVRSGNLNPFEQDAVIICSYQFCRKMEPYIRQTKWDLIVIDEAHRLRNVYKPTNKIANAIKQAIAPYRKVLLTATPLQNTLLELYGLVSIIDDYAFGDFKTYRAKFTRLGDNADFTDLNPDDATEIVIHVDQLKEGWDVTNLYTIVPLRAFNSRTLIEQAIGRGLRLPYGKRVGVPAVDRLTIVAHDKFQDIIDEANRGDSILKMGLVVIGKDIPDKHSKAVEIPTNLEKRLIGTPSQDGQPESKQKPLFNTEPERKAAKAALDAIQHFERLHSSRDLKSKEVQEQIASRVAEAIRPAQQALPTMEEEVDVKQVVAQVTSQFIETSIDIPKIVVVPSDDATYGFRDFDLDCKNIRLQPVSKDILIQNLQNNERYKLQDSSGAVTEQRNEDYLIRGLIDFDDISYDEHAELLYTLAGQMVAHLRSYLADDDEVLNVLVCHNRQLVDAIYAQMQQHYFETANSYEVKITKGFRTLHSTNVLAAADEEIRPFRQPIEDRKYIRGLVFGGFTKCLYPSQKFDSDSERRFAVILENDDSALKWFKPGRGVFAIHYRSGIEEGDYEPDFVVETKNGKYLCEPKQKDMPGDPVVIAKAEAASEWCRNASQVTGTPWTYLLIPHDAIDESKTLAGLAATYEYQSLKGRGA